MYVDPYFKFQKSTTLWQIRVYIEIQRYKFEMKFTPSEAKIYLPFWKSNKRAMENPQPFLANTIKMGGNVPSPLLYVRKTGV